MPAKRKNQSKPVAKKAKIEEVPKTEYDIKLESVLGALRNEEYPIEGGAANREMLILGAPCVFEEFVENRHANQTIMGGFIDEAFAGIRADLAGKVAEQLRIQETGEARKAELVAACEAARVTLEERTATLERETETRNEKKELWKTAGEALKEAKNNQKGIDSELGEAQVDLDKFTNGREWFVTLRDQGPDKTLLKNIKPIIGDLKLDGKFSNSFEILSRASADRGMLDTIVLNAVWERFGASITECNGRIEEIKTRGADIMAATDAANAAVVAAGEVLAAAENVVAEAKTAKTDSNAAWKESEKAIASHDKAVANAGELREFCEKNLADFALIEADLTWMKERRIPVPEPEPAAEEEKPADVEMGEAPTAEATEVPPAAEETAATEATEPVVEEPLPAEPVMDAPMEFIAA